MKSMDEQKEKELKVGEQKEKEVKIKKKRIVCHFCNKKLKLFEQIKCNFDN